MSMTLMPCNGPMACFTPFSRLSGQVTAGASRDQGRRAYGGMRFGVTAWRNHCEPMMGFAEPVIGPRSARTRWLNPSYEGRVLHLAAECKILPAQRRRTSKAQGARKNVIILPRHDLRERHDQGRWRHA